MNITIDIQEESSAVDSFGQPGLTWSNVSGLTGMFASMITSGGGEFYAAQRWSAETTAVFKLRYVAGISPKHRVKYGDRLFNILLVNNQNEQNEFILLTCKEVI